MGAEVYGQMLCSGYLSSMRSAPKVYGGRCYAVDISAAWGKANAALGRLPCHRYKRVQTGVGNSTRVVQETGKPISVHKTEGPSDIPATSAGMTPDIIPTPFHVGRNVAHHLSSRSEALIETNHVVHFSGQIYHSPEKGPHMHAGPLRIGAGPLRIAAPFWSMPGDLATS